MKQKLNIFLGFVSLISLVIIGLVITKIIPFDTSKLLPTNISEEIEIPEESKKETPKKVARHLSYNERIQKGDTLFQNEYYNLAIKEYAAASQLQPEEAKPYLKIGLVHFEQKDFKQAEENFIYALKLEKNNLEAKINLGKTQIQQEKFKEARDTFNEISKQSQTVKYYQALIAAFFNDHERAKELFQETINIKTAQLISENAKKFLESYQEFEKYEGGKEIHLKTILAKSYDQTSQFTFAANILQEVLKEEPEYRDAWILLGYAYLNQGKYGDARESFQEAFDLDPEKAETRYFLGLAYFGEDNLEKAILNLEIALENGFQPQIQVKQKLAEMYLLNENYEKAIVFYEEILDETEVDVDFYIRPIWIYIEHLNIPLKALELAHKARSEHPDEAMGYNLLGWAETANDNLSQAETDLRKALEINPNLAAAYLNLGTLYEKKKKIDLAKENYKKAYELGKDSSVSNLAAKKYNELILRKL